MAMSIQQLKSVLMYTWPMIAQKFPGFPNGGLEAINGLQKADPIVITRLLPVEVDGESDEARAALQAFLEALRDADFTATAVRTVFIDHIVPDDQKDAARAEEGGEGGDGPEEEPVEAEAEAAAEAARGEAAVEEALAARAAASPIDFIPPFPKKHQDPTNFRPLREFSDEAMPYLMAIMKIARPPLLSKGNEAAFYERLIRQALNIGERGWRGVGNQKGLFLRLGFTFSRGDLDDRHSLTERAQRIDAIFRVAEFFKDADRNYPDGFEGALRGWINSDKPDSRDYLDKLITLCQKIFGDACLLDKSQLSTVGEPNLMARITALTSSSEASENFKRFVGAVTSENPVKIAEADRPLFFKALLMQPHPETVLTNLTEEKLKSLRATFFILRKTYGEREDPSAILFGLMNKSNQDNLSFNEVFTSRFSGEDFPSFGSIDLSTDELIQLAKNLKDIPDAHFQNILNLADRLCKLLPEDKRNAAWNSFWKAMFVEGFDFNKLDNLNTAFGVFNIARILFALVQIEDTETAQDVMTRVANTDYMNNMFELLSAVDGELKSASVTDQQDFIKALLKAENADQFNNPDFLREAVEKLTRGGSPAIALSSSWSAAQIKTYLKADRGGIEAVIDFIQERRESQKLTDKQIDQIRLALAAKKSLTASAVRDALSKSQQGFPSNLTHLLGIAELKDDTRFYSSLPYNKNTNILSVVGISDERVNQIVALLKKAIKIAERDTLSDETKFRDELKKRANCRKSIDAAIEACPELKTLLTEKGLYASRRKKTEWGYTEAAGKSIDDWRGWLEAEVKGKHEARVQRAKYRHQMVGVGMRVSSYPGSSEEIIKSPLTISGEKGNAVTYKEFDERVKKVLGKVSVFRTTITSGPEEKKQVKDDSKDYVVKFYHEELSEKEASKTQPEVTYFSKENYCQVTSAKEEDRLQAIFDAANILILKGEKVISLRDISDKGKQLVALIATQTAINASKQEVILLHGFVGDLSKNWSEIGSLLEGELGHHFDITGDDSSGYKINRKDESEEKTFKTLGELVTAAVELEREAAAKRLGAEPVGPPPSRIMM